MAEYIYGKNSVLTVLEQAPERVFKVYLSDQMKPDSRIGELIGLVNAHGIVLVKVPRQKLDRMVQEGMVNPDPEDQRPNHQGVVASVAPRPLWDIHDVISACQPKIEAGEKPVVLMLDGVTDAGNMGAILRVADAVGVEAVVLGKHSSAGLGPGVSKTSSGADQVVNLAVVTNLTQSLEKLKAAGFWVVGTMLSEKAQEYTTIDFNMPTVLVMGSEGKGLSRLVAEHCDFAATIPMMGKMASLNVASATAVVLYEMLRQKQVHQKKLAAQKPSGKPGG